MAAIAGPWTAAATGGSCSSCIALSIPALVPAIRAISDAMADLEQLYPDAIPTALREETITR